MYWKWYCLEILFGEKGSLSSLFFFPLTRTLGGMPWCSMVRFPPPPTRWNPATSDLTITIPTLFQVVPLLHQLYDCGSQSSHHVYMLLIILLILSQDDCFNKSIHESVCVSVSVFSLSVSVFVWWIEHTTLYVIIIAYPCWGGYKPILQ